MPQIPKFSPPGLIPGSAPSTQTDADHHRGGNGGGGQAQGQGKAAARTPQLEGYAAQYSTDFSGTASNTLPDQGSGPGDAPAVQMALADRPAAAAVKNASGPGDVGPDVFSMACMEALVTRQGPNGAAAYDDFSRSIGSAGLRSAMDNFVNAHIDEPALGPGSPPQSYSDSLLAQARTLYPADTGSQAQAFRDDLYNLLGRWGVQSDVWPKLQADGLIPNDDGSIPQPGNNAGDAQNAYATLSPQQRQEMRNDLYNLTQGTPYGALWQHMDAWGLAPQGDAPSGQGRDVGTRGGQSTTNNNNNAGGTITNNNSRGSYAGGASTNQTNAGSGSGSFTNNNNNGGTQAQPSGNTGGFGSYNAQVTNNNGGPSANPSGRTYSAAQAGAFNPTVTDATMGVYVNAANNSQDAWVRSAAGRVCDNGRRLQADQNWLIYANQGAAAAGPNGSAPDGDGVSRPASYWQQQVQLACGSMQDHWEAQRDLEAQYWNAQSRISPSDLPTYQRYTMDQSYTSAGEMPAGFRSAVLPNTGIAPGQPGTSSSPQRGQNNNNNF